MIPTKEPEFWISDVFNDPRGLVERYIQFKKEGVSKHDGILEYQEKLEIIKDVLALHKPEDKLKQYFWLIKEKHKCTEEEDFEYSAVLRDAQKDLTDVLCNINILKEVREFLEKKNIEDIDFKFEKYLLSIVEKK